jgi:hypothetical protein
MPETRRGGPGGTFSPGAAQPLLLGNHEKFERTRRHRRPAMPLPSECRSLNGQLRMTCSERFVVPMINRFMHRHPHLSVYVLLASI